MQCRGLLSTFLAATVYVFAEQSQEQKKQAGYHHTAGKAINDIFNIHQFAAAKQRIEDARTIFGPVPSTMFANHSSAVPPNQKRSLTVSNVATNAAGDVALRDAATMYYAPDGFHPGSGKHFATLDVSTQSDKTKILSTEHFASIIKEMDCDESGRVDVKFNTGVPFKQVREEWLWVNRGANNTIILITENEDCDRNITDGTPRQPWRVTNAQFNEPDKKVSLTAKAVSFEEAFGKNWHVEIQHDEYKIPRLRKRKESHVRIDEDFSHVGINLPSKLSPAGMLSNEDALGRLSCSTCHVHGDLDLTASLSGLRGGRIQLTASHLWTSIDVSLEIYTAGKDGVAHDTEVWGTTFPGAGIYIKGLLDLGPTIKFLLSSEIKTPMKEQTALSVGYNLTFPEDIRFEWDLARPTELEMSGLSPEMHLLPPGVSNNLRFEGSVGPRLELSLAANILGQGAGVSLSFNAATLGFNMSVGEEGQSCGANDRNALELDSPQASSSAPSSHMQKRAGKGNAHEEGKQDDKPSPSPASPQPSTTPSSIQRETSIQPTPTSPPTTKAAHLSLYLAQSILASASAHLFGLNTHHPHTLIHTTYPLATTCIPITRSTSLTPSPASSDITSYVPWTGNLGDLATQQVRSSMRDAASAYRGLATGWGKSVVTSVVVGEVTRLSKAAEVGSRITAVEGQVTSAVASAVTVAAAAAAAPKAESVATGAATRVESVAAEATSAVASVARGMGCFFHIGC